MSDYVAEYENGASISDQSNTTVVAGLDIQNENLLKWFIMAGAGVLTIGLGISFIGESIIRKREGRSWFGLGSIGIAAFNLGLSMFGDAVKHRMHYELENKE